MVSAVAIPWHDWLHYFHHWNEVFQWPLYFVLGWIAIYIRRWRRNHVEEAAQGWPSAEGNITSGKVTRLAHTNRQLVTLEYSYFVEEYRYGKYTHEFSKKEEAEEFIRQLTNKHVQIRYNPSNPKQSVLEQRVAEQYVLLAKPFG